ncbi:MAG: hypothetical protein ACYTGH_20550 [Planctomycetota bacterium]
MNTEFHRLDKNKTHPLVPTVLRGNADLHTVPTLEHGNEELPYF